MDAFGVFKLIILIVVFDVAFCDKYCDKEFRARKYIPDFMDGLKNTNLEVLYNDRSVNCGETLALTEVLNAPTLKYKVKGRCPNITVISFSPDLIVNPPYPYWIAFNVPSSALEEGFNNGGDITDQLAGRNQGDIIAPYIAPDDPSSAARRLTVIHLIYCQCRYISDKRELDRIDRLHFDVKSYMKEHGLKCPVAGLFHQVSVTGLPAPDLPVELAPLDVPIPDLPYGHKLPLGPLANPNVPV